MPVPASFRAMRDAHNARRDPIADALATAGQMLPAGYTLTVDASRVAILAPDDAPVDVADPAEDWSPVYVLHYPAPDRIVDAATCAISHARKTESARLTNAIRPKLDDACDAWAADPSEPNGRALDAWAVIHHLAEQGQTLPQLLAWCERHGGAYVPVRAFLVTL